MIEIRFHGRGGQGAVTSAELLALAAIGEGKYAQAFPSFGPERRGAPVVAFCRIDEERIRIRANIYEPDIVVVLDASLLKIVNVAAGLKKRGCRHHQHGFSRESKGDLANQKPDRSRGRRKNCEGDSRPSHHQYDVAGIFGQGIGSGQEGIIYPSASRSGSDESPRRISLLLSEPIKTPFSSNRLQ